ncbi:hypothetical protein EDB89DRAFT_1906095 [Lactarius sanguifluus]|nr:hypothetical protein EDB89DRAFT_1906095 [Lactarius sanguifluus]
MSACWHNSRGPAAEPHGLCLGLAFNNAVTEPCKLCLGLVFSFGPMKIPLLLLGHSANCQRELCDPNHSGDGNTTISVCIPMEFDELTSICCLGAVHMMGRHVDMGSHTEVNRYVATPVCRATLPMPPSRPAGYYEWMKSESERQVRAVRRVRQRLRERAMVAARDALVRSGLGFGPELHRTAPEVRFRSGSGLRLS